MITLLVASECQIGLGVRICQYVELFGEAFDL